MLGRRQVRLKLLVSVSMKGYLVNSEKRVFGDKKYIKISK